MNTEEIIANLTTKNLDLEEQNKYEFKGGNNERIGELIFCSKTIR